MMPRGDGTGPAGAGPMTGRGLGFCSGYATPGYTKGFPRGGGGFGWRAAGRGARGGFYGGYGRRPVAYPQTPPVAAPPAGGYGASPAGGYAQQSYGAGAYGATDELTALQNQAQALEEQLENIRARMEELQSSEG